MYRFMPLRSPLNPSLYDTHSSLPNSQGHDAAQLSRKVEGGTSDKVFVMCADHAIGVLIISFSIVAT